MNVFLRENFLEMLLVIHRGGNDLARACYWTEQSNAIDGFGDGLRRSLFQLSEMTSGKCRVKPACPALLKRLCDVVDAASSHYAQAIVVKSADAHGRASFTS